MANARRWIDAENGAAALPATVSHRLPAFAKKLVDKPDVVSTFLSGQLDEANRASLAGFSTTNANANAVRSALAEGSHQDCFRRGDL